MAVVRQSITLDQLCEKVLELFKGDGDTMVFKALDSIKCDLRDNLNIEASPQEVVEACNALRDKGLIETAIFRAELSSDHRSNDYVYKVLLKLKPKAKTEKRTKKR